MSENSRKPGNTTHINVGSLALERGMITQAQLREALTEHAREAAAGNADVRLGEILKGHGFLTEEQFTALVEQQQKEANSPSSRAAAPQSSKRDTKFLVEGNFGKYRILRQVARGGMGVVYEALDPVLNRRVALKVLRFKDDLSPEDAEEGRGALPPGGAPRRDAGAPSQHRSRL